MAEVIKIVLTGGPCGGKTTALNFLKDELEKLNIKVRKYIKHMKWQEDKIKCLKLQLKDIQSLGEI